MRRGSEETYGRVVEVEVSECEETVRVVSVRHYCHWEAIDIARSGFAGLLFTGAVRSLLYLVGCRASRWRYGTRIGIEGVREMRQIEGVRIQGRRDTR